MTTKEDAQAVLDEIRRTLSKLPSTPLGRSQALLGVIQRLEELAQSIKRTDEFRSIKAAALELAQRALAIFEEEKSRKSFRYTVTVTCESLEQAQRVMNERLNGPGDYGFDYNIAYELTYDPTRTPNFEYYDDPEGFDK